MVTSRASDNKTRCSSIEMLRIIAMLMIVFNHLQWRGGFIATFLSGWGGVGDVLFFTISAWFLCDERMSLKRNLCRIWRLEQQILFYSLGILAACGSFAYFGLHQISSWSSVVAQSLLPIITCLWWYPMSYMLFLLIHPYLTAGLKSLQWPCHRNLVIVLILSFSIIPMVKTRTGVLLDVGWNLMLFIYLYIIISYIRWYIAEKLTIRNGRNALLLGLAMALISVLALSRVHIPLTYPILWMNSPRCLPSLLMGLGLFTLALNCDGWKSGVMNRVASCTLAPYLIWSHPEIRSMVNAFISDLPYRGAMLIVTQAAIGIALLCVGLFIDFGRQLIFRFTVNSHPYKWLNMFLPYFSKVFYGLSGMIEPNN